MKSVFMQSVDEWQSLKYDIWQSLKTDIRHLDLHINYIYRIRLLFFTDRNSGSCAEKKSQAAIYQLKIST